MERKPEQRDSVWNEPHLRPAAPRPDDSEQRAARHVANDARRANERRDSVYDELDILPGRPSEVVDQDWSCSVCGYNRRGLRNDHPCPECGSREFYRPPPTPAQGYGAWLRERQTRVRPSTGWLVAGGCAILGGGAALIAAFFNGELFLTTSAPLMALLVVALISPIVSETMKIAAAALVVELRPYVFQLAGQLRLATGGAALVFAVLDNLLYQMLAGTNATFLGLLWRWTIGVLTQVGCTYVASSGVLHSWRRTLEEGRPPRLVESSAPLVAAMCLHMGYNIMYAALHHWLPL